MAISNKILSQVPAEDEFSSTSSRHILVEDGGIIKRLNKAGLKELPVVTSEDAGKVVVVDGEGNYALANAGGGGAVSSVNGKTGEVVLVASDVGALPDDTVIPTAVTVDSELSNTSENPVQNKTIALALNELHGSMDDMAEMLDSMIMLRTELTVDTTQDAWSGANWDELIAAAKNGRAVSLGVDGADAQTVLLRYDEQADSAETKIIETEPKIYYYSTLAGAVSDSNAGTVGTNADASQDTAVASLYVDDNGLPNIVLLQNTSITSGLSFKRNAVLDLNGHKITAELGNPESQAYAVLVNRGYSLRIKGQTLGSAIESNTGSGSDVTLLYNNVGSYLEVLGGEYTVNGAETTLGVCVRNYGNMLLKDMTINATAQKVGGITSGSSSVSLRQNNNIQNVTVNVVGLSDSTRAIDIQNAESTLISNCHLYANSDTESGRIYGIYIDNTSKPTIIQNSEIVADSNYHFADGSYTVLSTGISAGTMCSYLLLQNCTVKGCHASAELHCSTDIDGGYYSSAGHGVYFCGTENEYRVKGVIFDDLYVGTHTNTNQNHVGAYIGGSSGATGISVYADNTNISGSNYSWVLRNSSGESDNALYISNSNINNKTIRIDDTATLKLYLGEGNTFDADDTTRPANVVETGADYTFTPTATEISYSGQPVTGSLTERDPGSVAIREVSLSANGNVTVTDYELVQKSELSGGGGGSVTPESIVTATGQMTTEQAVRTRENLGAESMESITYSALKTLRDSGNLVPGKQYRITDYVCTVANDSEARAVSHPYDIIVTADDASTLNENARACLHDGDTYYSAQSAQADLAAWELKYCLDNDTNRFAWADSTNGKGVVFWLKDDWNNECPYDFKQIQFKRYKITACTKSPDLVDTYLAASEVSDDITYDSTDFIWAYTFSGVLDESLIDTSVYNWVYSNREGYLHCYDNAIKTFAATDGVIRLNNIVFLASNIPCHSNTFGNNCSSNTFGTDCSSNTFGNNCRSNTFGNNCHSNTFGNNCRSNTFGNNCSSNTFGNNCRSNTFGTDCSSNTFGTDAQGDEASAYCRWCTFEDGVKGVVLSNDSATNANQIQNYHVLNGTQGVMKTGFVTGNPVKTPITINASLGLSYCTYVGKNTSGTVKTWNPMDSAT